MLCVTEFKRTGAPLKQANRDEGDIYVHSDGYGQFQDVYMDKSHNLEGDAGKIRQERVILVLTYLEYLNSEARHRIVP